MEGISLREQHKHTWKKTTTTKCWKPASQCDPRVLLILLFWALFQLLWMYVSQTALKLLLSSSQEGSSLQSVIYFFLNNNKRAFISLSLPPLASPVGHLTYAGLSLLSLHAGVSLVPPPRCSPISSHRLLLLLPDNYQRKERKKWEKIQN